MQAPQRGLPRRIYLPIVIAFAVVFLALVAYLVGVAFGVTGSVFGAAASNTNNSQATQSTNVEGGGPPPAVMEQLQTLRTRIAKNPRDVGALTELGDMYETVGKYAQAEPYYQRALAVDPKNIAAQTGLQQAQSALGRQ